MLRSHSRRVKSMKTEKRAPGGAWVSALLMLHSGLKSQILRGKKMTQLDKGWREIYYDYSNSNTLSLAGQTESRKGKSCL